MVALVGQRVAVELAATDHAEAVSTWSAVSVVQDALGGGIEMVGALWVLLVSAAAIRSSALPGARGARCDRRDRWHRDARPAAGGRRGSSSGSASSPGTSGPASSFSATDRPGAPHDDPHEPSDGDARRPARGVHRRSLRSRAMRPADVLAGDLDTQEKTMNATADTRAHSRHPHADRASTAAPVDQDRRQFFTSSSSWSTRYQPW